MENINGCTYIIEGNASERSCNACKDQDCRHHPEYKSKEPNPNFFNH